MGIGSGIGQKWAPPNLDGSWHKNVHSTPSSGAPLVVLVVEFLSYQQIDLNRFIPLDCLKGKSQPEFLHYLMEKQTRASSWDFSWSQSNDDAIPSDHPNVYSWCAFTVGGISVTPNTLWSTDTAMENLVFPEGNQTHQCKITDAPMPLCLFICPSRSGGLRSGRCFIQLLGRQATWSRTICWCLLNLSKWSW